MSGLMSKKEQAASWDMTPHLNTVVAPTAVSEIRVKTLWNTAVDREWKWLQVKMFKLLSIYICYTQKKMHRNSHCSDSFTLDIQSIWH